VAEFKEQMAAAKAAEAGGDAAIEAATAEELTEEELAAKAAEEDQKALEMAQAAVAAEEEAGVGGDDPEEAGMDGMMPMYFERPQQLLEIFKQLEEQNLFLIQNSQETEEALEELKNKYSETKQRMESETEALHSQILALQASISAEEEKGKALRDKTNEQAEGTLTGHETTLEELSAKVADVYVKCGFDSDASIGTLQMLTNIEAKLEEYLSVIDVMPDYFVETAEKHKEKERRQRAREEKLQQQRQEQERRVQRSLERAQAPVHKRTGKAVMFRSQPPVKRVVEDDGPKVSSEEEELREFLARGY